LYAWKFPGNHQEGEYKGNLMVEQHRYFMAGGATIGCG
jgi:hypothetical protein